MVNPGTPFLLWWGSAQKLIHTMRSDFLFSLSIENLRNEIGKTRRNLRG
jgi:hypothetical protein